MRKILNTSAIIGLLCAAVSITCLAGCSEDSGGHGDVIVLGKSLDDDAADIIPDNIYTTTRNDYRFTVLCFHDDQIQEGDYLYFSKDANDTTNYEISLPGKKGITCEFYNVRMSTGVMEDSVLMVYADREGYIVKAPFNVVAVFNGGKTSDTIVTALTDPMLK